MQQFIERTTRFLQSEDGPTAIEYAVMLAMVIAVCVLAIGVFGVNTKNMLTNISNSTGS